MRMRTSIALLVIYILTTNAEAAVYSGGSGTETDPYEIESVGDWRLLAASPEDWGKYFLLTNDIDFAGENLPCVAADEKPGNYNFDGTQFTGVFDGGSHVLRNGEVKGVSYLGLFGYLGAAGVIHHLGVESVDITGGDALGGLVGWNDGAVRSCYATGSIWAGGYAGGLVGYNNGTISSCYSTGGVAAYFAGGLVGANSGTITSCYATGSVNGDLWREGGLVEYGGGAESSYWDINTSGVLESDGGEGRTTDEMTYPYAENTYVGWDFTMVWAADENGNINNGYPYLRKNGSSPEEGEDAPSGCGKQTQKDLFTRKVLDRVLGDWLLVGVTLLSPVVLNKSTAR